MVGAFQQNYEVGKDQLLTTHWYTANHAFANPTGGRYDEDDAALACTNADIPRISSSRLIVSALSSGTELQQIPDDPNLHPLSAVHLERVR